MTTADTRRERAIVAKEELIEKLRECSGIADHISGILWNDERTARKFDDIALEIWTVTEEVKEYDFNEG